METEATWHPPTLTDAIEAGVLINLPMLAPIKGKPEKVKYLCTCGTYAWSQQFHDVRGITGIDGSFICDGCYTSLERNRVDIDGDGKPNTIKEFKVRFIKIQGAPIDLQRKVGKRFDETGEI